MTMLKHESVKLQAGDALLAGSLLVIAFARAQAAAWGGVIR
jgi:hypothetical protein